MKKILKQPLIHFLVLGAIFFVVYELGPGKEEAADESTIVIDQASLMTFMQYRNRAFNKDYFEEKLESMPVAQRQKLIDDLVREEALYREAKRLGLDKDDYIIKQRVIQKLEFITQGFSSAVIQVDEAGLASYFQQNQRDYAIPPMVTFTHVYFSRDKHGAEGALQKATTKMAQLNQQQVHFSEGISHGDRFPYHVNYVEKPLDFVASHFGDALANELSSFPANENLWVGPIESDFGFHVVMLSNRTQERTPELEEVREQVDQNLRKKLMQENMDAAIDAIIANYDTQISEQITAMDSTIPEKDAADENSEKTSTGANR